MNEIQQYADKNNIKPTTVLQKATSYGGGAWARWQAGGSCSVRNAEKIRQYMKQGEDASS